MIIKTYKPLSVILVTGSILSLIAVGAYAASRSFAAGIGTAYTLTSTIADGSTVSGTITWTVDVTPQPVQVDFYLDGVLRNTETSAPYASSDPPQTDEGLVDTTKLTNGSHTFQEVAVYANSTWSAKHIVTVSNSVSVPASTPPPAPSSSTSCTKYASTSGSDSGAGTLASPYLTPQKLVDNLSAGQTGCLRGGKYVISGSVTFGMRFNHGGSAGAPITLTSYPGEKGEITTNSAISYMILIPAGSNYITLTNLKISVTNGANTGTGPLRINGSNVTVSGSELTDNYVGGECILLGGTGSGETISNVHIVGNLIHDCGQTSQDNKDHCIYAAHLSSGLIERNTIYNCAAYVIQLYPDSHNVVFDHNTTDGGSPTVRGGLLFGAEGAPVSSDNTMTNNVVTYAPAGGITGYWGGPVGTGNTANNNCLYSAAISLNGFTASGNITATADPFNNRAGHDYSLKAGSACAGKGA